MKSVGEVMAIGRTFQESLQKALRGLETGMCGLNEIIDVNAEECSRDVDVRNSSYQALNVCGMWRMHSALDATLEEYLNYQLLIPGS